ncbi:MAG: hypothetical protein RL885_23925 [Planctomycetota bacterium]
MPILWTMLIVSLPMTALQDESAQDVTTGQDATREAENDAIGAAGPDIIVLDHDKMLRGEIVSTSKDGLKFRFRENGDEVVAGFDKSELSPTSWYFARREDVKSADEHVALADFCLEHELFRLAETELRRAIEQEGELEESLSKKLALANRGAARQALDSARIALEDGDFDVARRRCARVLTGETDAVARAEAMKLLSQVESERVKSAVADQKETVDAPAPQYSEEVTKIREELAVLEEKGRKLDQAGLMSDKRGDAQRAFRGAIAAYQEARQRLEKRREKLDDETRLASPLRGLDENLQSEIIDSYINLGSLELVAGSYVSALEYANRALAVDRRSSEARRFRERVEMAAAMSSYRGGLRRGRR